MALTVRKNDFVACKQQRHPRSPVSALVFHSLQSFISQLESSLVRNPEDRGEHRGPY